MNVEGIILIVDKLTSKPNNLFCKMLSSFKNRFLMTSVGLKKALM